MIEVSEVDNIVEKLYGVTAYQKVLTENMCHFFHRWKYGRRAYRSIRTCQRCKGIQITDNNASNPKWIWSNQNYFELFEREPKKMVDAQINSFIPKKRQNYTVRQAFVDYIVESLSPKLPIQFKREEDFVNWLETNLMKALEDCPDQWLKDNIV